MRAPLAFVLIALLLLLAIPVIIDGRTAEYRRAVAQVAEPARSEVTHIQLALAVAGSLLSDYLMARSESMQDRYREAVSTQDRAYARLGPLARQLGPEVSHEHEALGSLALRWRSSAVSLMQGSPTPTDIAAQQDLYEELLLTTARLDEAITTEAQRRRSAVANAERIKLTATLLLVPLALVAALVVARLGHRLRRYADEADRGRREIEQLMEGKSRLIRGFSHDVKNPLGAADGYGELLEEGLMGELNPKQKESVHRMRASIHFALKIITDLNEISRAEGGELEIRPEPVDLAGLVHEVVVEHQAAALSSRLRLDTTVPSPVPVLQTDPARVRQILSNLISNAVKYTDGGKITVTLDRVTDARGRRPGPWLAVTVQDGGPGIPAHEQERIFEEFVRLEPHDKPGTGLGLAISKRIAHSLGGDLTLESEVGAGSMFTLWLPVHKAEDAV